MQENKDYLSIYQHNLIVISLHLHFARSEIAVFVVVDRIIPTAELVEDIATKALLELVESIHRMRGVGIGSNAKHIVFEAFTSLGYLHSPPLQGVGGHHVA